MVHYLSSKATRMMHAFLKSEAVLEIVAAPSASNIDANVSFPVRETIARVFLESVGDGPTSF